MVDNFAEKVDKCPLTTPTENIPKTRVRDTSLALSGRAVGHSVDAESFLKYYEKIALDWISNLSAQWLVPSLAKPDPSAQRRGLV